MTSRCEGVGKSSDGGGGPRGGRGRVLERGRRSWAEREGRGTEREGRRGMVRVEGGREEVVGAREVLGVPHFGLAALVGPPEGARDLRNAKGAREGAFVKGARDNLDAADAGRALVALAARGRRGTGNMASLVGGGEGGEGTMSRAKWVAARSMASASRQASRSEVGRRGSRERSSPMGDGGG